MDFSHLIFPIVLFCMRSMEVLWHRLDLWISCFSISRSAATESAMSSLLELKSSRAGRCPFSSTPFSPEMSKCEFAFYKKLANQASHTSSPKITAFQMPCLMSLQLLAQNKSKNLTCNFTSGLDPRVNEIKLLIFVEFS